jgi:hypothetical protein
MKKFKLLQPTVFHLTYVSRISEKSCCMPETIICVSKFILSFRIILRPIHGLLRVYLFPDGAIDNEITSKTSINKTTIDTEDRVHNKC